MKSSKWLVALVLLLGAQLVVKAQDKSPVKFGKVEPADFDVKINFDSGAGAIVIADIGITKFEGSNKASFSLIYKRTKRIKIINKTAFDAATEKIYTYYQQGGGEEKLVDLKGYTYNLENGKVVTTKLDNGSIFKEKLDKNYFVQKFTLPAVKEGSIIEYTYTVNSDYIFNLRSWDFQTEYPCMWTEYQVEIPDFFRYAILTQGYNEMYINKSDSYSANFRVTIPGGTDRNEQVSLDGVVKTNRWVMRNIPALREERYTTSIKNYISRIEFQLASVQYPDQPYQDMMGNWALLSEKLNKSENFGESISKNNGWMTDDIKAAVGTSKDKLEKAKKIFAYVRDNFTCDDHSEIYLATNLKDVFKNHKGSVADINLLLTAMMRHEDINAYPVLLSTRSHGFTSEIYPLLQRFNYVVTALEIDNAFYYLDASVPYNAFGKLPIPCYNGHARIIGKNDALPVYFVTDSLKEQKLTSVIIVNGEKGGMSGSCKAHPGYYESQSIREQVGKSGSEDFVKSLKPSFGFETEISNFGIDSLKQMEMPVWMHYDFTFSPGKGDDIIYFNPMLTEGFKSNPFKSDDRKYPVEMPYASDETYLLTMDIPEGYVVDELPKSTKVKFNDEDGYFEYLVVKSETGIQLRSRVIFNKATFLPEEYSSLRDFFAYIVKKQSEQIVFKKKK